MENHKADSIDHLKSQSKLGLEMIWPIESREKKTKTAVLVQPFQMLQRSSHQFTAHGMGHEMHFLHWKWPAILMPSYIIQKSLGGPENVVPFFYFNLGAQNLWDPPGDFWIMWGKQKCLPSQLFPFSCGGRKTIKNDLKISVVDHCLQCY